ncbi:MAG: 16S rRNA (cytosine(967)-C(5))-methyltransferase RsmB [Syntrophobacteraceae bacterium]
MISARSLAHQILLHLGQKSGYPDRLLRATLSRHPHLDPRDRALLTELVYGVLRWQGRLDWHIDQLSKVRPDKIAPATRALLRIALYQLFFLDRIPAHAAVNEAVSLCKATQPEHVARFVNGLLREAVRRGEDWNWPSSETAADQRVSVLHAHPLWFVRRCIQELGAAATQELCEANNRPAPMVLRVNALKTTVKAVIDGLKEEGIEASASPHLEGAIQIVSPKLDIATTRAYRDGWIQVQDEASQLVGLLVSPRSGERVLDLCAGFGGKSTHLAILMQNEGEILAVDRSAWKLEDLEKNARRQGVSIVRTLSRDIVEMDSAGVGLFDRVLIDAPCSGFGVLRRNPDIKWRRHLKDPYRFSQVQGQLLSRAAQFIRPGGTLVYATCTVFEEENERVATIFMEEHPGWAQEPAAPYLPGGHELWTAGPYLRTWPHRHNMDGFFGARFRRME